MRFLGEIVRLQVQVSSLKVGEAPHKRYDPEPLTSVPSLLVEPGGVIGRTAWGDDLIDVHHRDHPASKQRAGIERHLDPVHRPLRDDARSLRSAPHRRDRRREHPRRPRPRSSRKDELAAGVIIETGGRSSGWR